MIKRSANTFAEIQPVEPLIDPILIQIWLILFCAACLYDLARFASVYFSRQATWQRNYKRHSFNPRVHHRPKRRGWLKRKEPYD